MNKFVIIAFILFIGGEYQNFIMTCLALTVIIVQGGVSCLCLLFPNLLTRLTCRSAFSQKERTARKL